MADKAVRAAPKAAVAWVGVCLGLEILSNPITETSINRRGIAYVLSRTAWYWNLVDLLLDENKAERSTGLQDELECHIVQLYQKLLLYQMKSVCLYYRNRAATVIRDVLKCDDWTGQLDDIQNAEAAVQRDAEQYNTEQIKLHLQHLATTAQFQESKFQDIYSTIQDQIRLRQERHQDDRDKQCLKDLYVTDPREDKMHLQDAKGGLLTDSYRWILDHADFRRWRDDEQSRLLWVKGDPGKGKTMLLCGIIDELKASMKAQGTTLLSYFFCQTTDSRINTATSVLRGLIYMLVLQRPLLISHMRSDILANMLHDQSVERAYVVIDALDECTTDLQRLLKLIVDKPSASSRFKWIVSSRNWPNIEEQLDTATQKVRLCLELNQDSISAAVGIYISYEVDRFARLKKYDVATRDAVRDGLSSNANDTLRAFPPGLDALYKRMLAQISGSDDAHLCKQILAVVSTVYRPITLKELTSFVDMPDGVSNDHEALAEIVRLCGSFLTLREDSVYFVHQSALDFLLGTIYDEIFPTGIEHMHYTIFSRSLQAMSDTLVTDLYGLGSPGTTIDQVKQPEPNPLAATRYSCVYWVKHLCDWDSRPSARHNLLGYHGEILAFMQEHLLHWFDALSLTRAISDGVLAISSLESRFVADAADELAAFVYDAKRFILHNRSIVEEAPLQLYSSALVFTPENSIVRRQFEKQVPGWIHRLPTMSKQWSPLLRRLSRAIQLCPR
ncbi:NACHT domain-containing protein [Hirsutella rhossiliensis]|uniref:NACHT domain-containing protein n=1 Tax=Hirsutella rhossiliensis TaxID=111463 RepID=A0A9P8MNN8_9HYPO|nr:NACHT domain-containing protein [Hirsutella rhossiliensis]KAH0958793.1 NACHT domain-containing protein [Hirsutella rhossiliensis]